MTDIPAPPGTPPPLGTLFGQHYRIDRVLGVGGMGMVYAATDQRLGRQVALKVVLGHYAQSEDFVRRFQREAEILAKLDSPHVISIFDHGVENGSPFIVTQYAAGGDLGKVLSARGVLPPALATRICAQLADALVAAHAVGVVHRDVKPANVLLRDDRVDRIHVYLSDFGVALTETSGLTVPGSVAGTWNYLAPERTAGEHGSPSSDLYSLGCVFWELLTGRAPYAGSDVEVAMEHLQAPVPQLDGDDEFTVRANEIVARTMAKSAADRYSSATELRDALRALAGGLGLTGSTMAPLGRRRRTAVVAGGVAAALVLVGGGVAAAVVLDGDFGNQGTAATAPAEDVEAVDGDVDGDGFGDVAWTDFDDDGYLHTSDGTALSEEEDRLPGAAAPTVLGDFDGDGTNELLTLSNDIGSTGASATATFVSGAFAGTSSAVRVPRTQNIQAPIYLAADLDGDGLDDLVVGVENQQGTSVAVARSSGDGLLEPREVWFEDADFATSGFLAGDVDGDGDDDVVAISNNEEFDGGPPGRIVYLLAEGDRLEATEDVVYDSSTQNVTGGGTLTDADGDGRDELLTWNFDNDILVWQWEDGELARPSAWFQYDDGDEARFEVLTPVTSDLDGDGTAELVRIPLGYDEDRMIEVYRAEGESFVPAPDFALALDPEITIEVFSGETLDIPLSD